MLTAYHHRQVLRSSHEIYLFCIQCSAMAHPYKRTERNCDIINVFMITLSFFFEINFETLEFLTNLFTYQIRMRFKKSLLSDVTPSNFTIFSILVRLLLTLSFSLLSVVKYEIYHY